MRMSPRIPLSDVRRLLPRLLRLPELQTLRLLPKRNCRPTLPDRRRPMSLPQQLQRPHLSRMLRAILRLPQLRSLRLQPNRERLLTSATCSVVSATANKTTAPIVATSVRTGITATPTASSATATIKALSQKYATRAMGQCLCKEGYAGARCDSCAPGFYGYPDCGECECSDIGSVSDVCNKDGKCNCLLNFSGRQCSRCSPGYYNYPECTACGCNNPGSKGVSCNDEGTCLCKPEFTGIQCEVCSEGFYNYPLCEGCNCDPAGVKETFGGCGTLPVGELCECKDRVTGRICNTCKPLFWDLQNSKDACKDCNCWGDGVVGNVMACDSATGKCQCKPFVAQRSCSSCADGFYNMTRGNMFGCTDCECDVGGSVDRNACDKVIGQCSCQPGVQGIHCDEPMEAYYFPKLHHLKYELEDGKTATGGQARFGYNDSNFPGYSWRGYALFNNVQQEVLQDVAIQKAGLYRMILRYVNTADEPSSVGTVKFKPHTAGDEEQEEEVRLDRTFNPKLTTVSGEVGDLAIPFVLKPGFWTVSVKASNGVLGDYFVLLPDAYFEAKLMQDHVHRPCVGGRTGHLCPLRLPRSGKIRLRSRQGRLHSRERKRTVEASHATSARRHSKNGTARLNSATSRDATKTSSARKIRFAHRILAWRKRSTGRSSGPSQHRHGPIRRTSLAGNLQIYRCLPTTVD